MKACSTSAFLPPAHVCKSPESAAGLLLNGGPDSSARAVHVHAMHTDNVLQASRGLVTEHCACISICDDVIAHLTIWHALPMSLVCSILCPIRPRLLSSSHVRSTSMGFKGCIGITAVSVFGRLSLAISGELCLMQPTAYNLAILLYGWSIGIPLQNARRTVASTGIYRGISVSNSLERLVLAQHPKRCC